MKWPLKMALCQISVDKCSKIHYHIWSWLRTICSVWTKDWSDIRMGPCHKLRQHHNIFVHSYEYMVTCTYRCQHTAAVSCRVKLTTTVGGRSHPECGWKQQNFAQNDPNAYVRQTLRTKRPKIAYLGLNLWANMHGACHCMLEFEIGGIARAWGCQTSSIHCRLCSCRL